MVWNGMRFTACNCWIGRFSLLVHSRQVVGALSCMQRHRRRPHSHPLTTTATTILDCDLVDASCAPLDFDNSAVVYPNVISEADADMLATALLALLKRRRYEKGHWDAVIVKYKELELSDTSQQLSPDAHQVFDRIRSLLKHNHLSSESTPQWLPPHVIDLHADGALNAHIDSVRFSGATVSGLSLLSPAIMRLKPSADALMSDGNDDDSGKRRDDDEHSMNGHVDLLLPPRSLYCLSGPSRFRYSHELLPSMSLFKRQAIARDHRLSVIFRDTKD